jgi:hypothetical protein
VMTQMHSATGTTSTCKRQRCDNHNEVKNYFRLHHEEVINSEIPLSHPSEQHVTCDHCNSVPCDWSTYEREIIEHVTGMYNDIIDAKDNKRNKQLLLFCYTAFTSLKQPMKFCPAATFLLTYI